jgi:hypothetical protein
VIGDLLSGLIWQARVGLRSGGARAFAAHGYVDNAYRPPRLPFVSVVGPLSFNVEPEREVGRQASAPVRVPGHVIGRARAATDSVPANGTLRLRFDGAATLTLNGLPGGSFAAAATGPALAAAIQTGVRGAMEAGGVVNAAGAPFTDPALLAAVDQMLQQASCRFDPDGKQLAIVADNGAVAFDNLSRVEVLDAPGSVAGALGLAPPDVARDGRTFLHRLPAPRAITVDMQINLWAASQQDLASLVEGLAVVVPTRGNLLTRPSLLLDDLADGATSLRLLDEGEPTLVDSLLHLEAPAGFVDRARAVVVTTTAGAAAAAGPARLAFTGTGTATARLYATPLVPTALLASNPAPLGLAVSFGLRLDAGGADGQVVRVIDIAAGGTTVLHVDAAIVNVANALSVDLQATATVNLAGAPVAISTTFRVPIAAVQGRFAVIHVRLDAPAGEIDLSLDGDPQRTDDTASTPVPPVTAPGGTTVAAPDMILTVGRGDAANPLGFSLGHLHVIAAPLGALDPSLRRSVTGAARLQPGDPIILVRSEDGVRPGGVRAQTMVASIDPTGVVQLTSPVVGAWPRGGTLLFRDESFFFQTAIKRRDDLLNHLYRACVDYRVSTFIEDPRTLSTSTLVDVTQTDVTPFGVGRNKNGAPGVAAVITDNHGNGSSSPSRVITKPGA